MTREWDEMTWQERADGGRAEGGQHLPRPAHLMTPFHDGTSDAQGRVRIPPVVSTGEDVGEAEAATEDLSRCPRCGELDVWEHEDPASDHWHLWCPTCEWRSYTVMDAFTTPAEVLERYRDE